MRCRMPSVAVQGAKLHRCGSTSATRAITLMKLRLDDAGRRGFGYQIRGVGTSGFYSAFGVENMRDSNGPAWEIQLIIMESSCSGVNNPDPTKSIKQENPRFSMSISACSD